MNSPAAIVKGLQMLQLGQQKRAAGDRVGAADAFARAVALVPNHPAIVLEYATLCEETGDWKNAAKMYRVLGTLRPNSNFEGKLALSLFNLEQFEDALPVFEAHLKRHPQDEPMRLRLAQALCKEKRWEEALVIARHLSNVFTCEATSDVLLNSLFNLAMRDELDAILDREIAANPDSPWVLALCGSHLLKSGRYAAGFPYLRALRQRYDPGHPDMHRPDAGGWDGKPFDGVLLIDGEQGLGEEILGASLFVDIVNRGQKAVVSCDPRLIPLFRRSFPTLGFVSRYDDSLNDSLNDIAESGVKYFRMQSMDLACLFRSGEKFPPQRPWLVADAERVDELRKKYRTAQDGNLLAGISWKSRREYRNSPDKNIALADLAPLLALPGFSWFNLQYGDTRPDLDTLKPLNVPLPVNDPEIDATQDIDALAAQISALDVVVSTSSTTAHLAAALGVRCHLLLPKIRPILWYWGYTGQTTPWYSSITIHRNSREDGWRDFAQVLARSLATDARPVKRS